MRLTVYPENTRKEDIGGGDECVGARVMDFFARSCHRELGWGMGGALLVSLL